MANNGSVNRIEERGLIAGFAFLMLLVFSLIAIAYVFLGS